MSALSVENISFSYEARQPVLTDVSFTVEEGACVCVAGANGSGKSTLLQLIAACIKPERGNVRIGDASVFKDQAARRKVGIVFQEPDNQLFMPTVWEDVAFAILNRGCPVVEAKEKALRTLDAVDARHLAERAPYKLSGGEKQRVAIASVLVGFQSGGGTDVLALDEPTASLDPQTRKKLISLLKNLPCTRIIATHDLDMALDLADETLFLHNGALCARSPAPGLLADQAFLQTIGLELPLSVARVWHRRG
jgi:cobalt/nickel transport system ATP-binding protein